MALVVEDGTGRSDSEAYVSVVEFKAYVDAFYGNLYNGKSDIDIERALRRACQFVDIQFDYEGDRLATDQVMEWPRDGVIDDQRAVVGVPKRIKRAACELAWRALSEDLMPDIERANRVKSESVGSLSVTYADDAPESKLFRIAEKLVSAYVRKTGADISMAPGGATLGASASGASAPYFTLGMHDTPLDEG